MAATAYSQSKEAQRNHRKLEREVAKWEAELTRLEEAAAAVQTDMAAPAALTDYVKMQELQAKLDAITAATNEAETAWEQAAEALEELES